MTEVRFGLIGAGVMGCVHAKNLAGRVAGAKLIAVCDVDSAAAEACAAANGVDAVLTNEADLLAVPELDAVVICTPPETHAAIIEAAASAGRQVFCEKPLERTLEAGDRAIVAAESAGVRLFVAFNRRYDPHYAALRNEVKSGRIGRALTAHLVARDPVEALGPAPRPAGDLYLSTTIHELDFACFLFGEPLEVYSTGGVMHDGPVVDDPDTATTVVRFAGGEIVTIENSRIAAQGYEQYFEVFGSAGIAVQPADVADRIVPFTADGRTPFFAQRYGQSYVAEMTDFVRCIAEDKPSPVAPREARLAQVLAHAAHEAYKSGLPVRVSDGG